MNIAANPEVDVDIIRIVANYTYRFNLKIGMNLDEVRNSVSLGTIHQDDAEIVDAVLANLMETFGKNDRYAVFEKTDINESIRLTFLGRWNTGSFRDAIRNLRIKDRMSLEQALSVINMYYIVEDVMDT